MEVIVVDNKSASSDEVARVVDEFDAELIANSENLGYTGGMNRGAAMARGEVLYLTEDDMVLDADCLLRLVESLLASPQCTIVAPVILNKITGEVVSAGGQVDLKGIFRKVDFTRVDDDGHETTYLSGAAMMFRAAGFASLGGFREEFFLYGEDAELCQRVLRTGGRLCVNRGAKVFHHPPGDERQDERVEFHKLKNLLALYALHARFRYIPEFAVRYGILSFARALRQDRAQARRLASAWGWFFRRSVGLALERMRASRNALRYRS